MVTKRDIMRPKFILSTIFVLVPLFLLAQRQGRKFDEMFEKYKTEKVAFLSAKLDLTVKEAEKFWPIYNEFQEKKEDLMKAGRPSFRRPDPDSLSTEQMQDIMETKFKNDLKSAKLAQDYHEKFKEILPIKKIFILYQAENEFMSSMLRKMRHSQDGQESRDNSSRPGRQ